MIAKSGSVLRRAFFAWVLIILAESVNGTFRTMVLVPRSGEAEARRIGFVIALGLIFAISTAFSDRMALRSVADHLAVGALWVMLTFAFEATLALFVAQIGLTKFLSEYDPTQGGLMSFGMFFLLIAPLLGSAASRALGRGVSDDEATLGSHRAP